jgi:hypothetical protein
MYLPTVVCNRLASTRRLCCSCSAGWSSPAPVLILINQLHAAESYLRILYSLSWSRYSPPFMKSRGSYGPRRSPPPTLILSQFNPFYTLPLCFCKIHLNIILPSTPKSRTWSRLSRLPYLTHSYYMPCLPYSSWFDHLDNYQWYTVWDSSLVMQFPYPPVTSSPSSPYIPLTTLFWNTLNLF